ncbi:MAG: glycosyltransferase [Methanobrevibacter sp.]|jgi:glycosyltransferase involved in cell wall biosynthesis|nr:glycosyltransferase [Candidatus Methanovirga procula]
MDDVKISIIIPVYNKEVYLKECLDSVINQSLKDIEIICINDGSKDDSLKILKEYGEKDDRIKIINQDNMGPGISRNKGIDSSKGKYLGFVDGDDCLLDYTSLEKMFNVGESNNSSMVSANLRINGNNGEIIVYHEKIDNIQIIQSEFYGIPWFFFKNIFRRKFLDDNGIYFPDCYVGEDPIFLAKVLAKLDSITLIPIDYYEYRPTFPKSNFCILEYIQHFIKVFKILKEIKFFKINLKYLNYLQNYLIEEKDSILKNEKEILELYENDSVILEFFELEFDLLRKQENFIKKIMNI